MSTNVATAKPKPFFAFLQAPSVVVLFLWMIVPLAMTIYFAFIRYSLLNPDVSGFAGIENFEFLWEDPAFFPSIWNSVILVGSVLIITVVAGTALAVLYDSNFFGNKIAALLVIAPFFVMPTVSALIWKNMIMHPVYGLIAMGLQKLGLPGIDFFGEYPLLSVIIIVSWEWMPFAFLVLFTAIKSFDQEQKEAAIVDGAGPVQLFFSLILSHLSRAIGVVVMIESIFLLSIFAEIHTTTSGGPGTASTNLTYLIFSLGLRQFDIGIASAGGILAVILANIVAYFLVKMLAKGLRQGS